MTSFSAEVAEWARKTEDALETIFQESLQRLVRELNEMVPVGDTGFLRSSLVASTTALPMLDRENPGAADGEYMAAIEMVIPGVELGQTVFLGYSAVYGARIHYGFTGPDSLGRTFNQSGRPWVSMVAQRWQGIVSEIEAKVKTELGL